MEKYGYNLVSGSKTLYFTPETLYFSLPLQRFYENYNVSGHLSLRLSPAGDSAESRWFHLGTTAYYSGNSGVVHVAGVAGGSLHRYRPLGLGSVDDSQLHPDFCSRGNLILLA